MHNHRAPLRQLPHLLLTALALCCTAGCASGAASRSGQTSSAESAPEGLVVPPFELEDQEGRRHKYTGRNKGPVVLVVSDRSAVPTNKEWDRWLLGRYGQGIDIFRILDLSDVPGILESYATTKVRESAEPPGIPILLDWKGTFLTSLSLEAKVTNIVVVGPDGRVSLTEAGSPDAERTARVARELERIRSSEPMPGKKS